MDYPTTLFYHSTCNIEFGIGIQTSQFAVEDHLNNVTSDEVFMFTSDSTSSLGVGVPVITGQMFGRLIEREIIFSD